MSSRVDIENLHARYGAVEALRGVSLCVPAGQFLAVIGPSGCGKTTLLRCLAGFIAPSAGTISFDGRPVSTAGTSVSPERRDVGLVFQNYALWPHMTALDNVAYPLRLKGLSKSERTRRAAELLDQLGLGGLGSRRPAQLSGGQQQRVALARALAREPRLLLLDEPLSNVDAALREELQSLLLRVTRERSLTVILATHDQHEAMALADRLAVLRDGCLEQVGTPEAIEERPASAFVARFTGANNVLPVTVVARHESDTTVALPDGEQVSVAATAPAGDSAVLVVSPATVMLCAASESGVAGVVTRCLRRHGRTELQIDAGGTIIRVWTSDRQTEVQGARVRLSLHRSLLLPDTEPPLS